ncbi:hypothetical protein V8017_12425 [Stenotrophomonas rhizophila]
MATYWPALAHGVPTICTGPTISGSGDAGRITYGALPTAAISMR